MKTFNFLLIVFSLLILNSCRDGYDCFTPPGEIVLKLVDSKGVNLIETKELSLTDLKITAQNSNYEPNVDLKEIPNYLVTVRGAGWHNGTEKFDISSPMKNFTIKVISKELTGKCGGYNIQKVEFEGIETSQTQNVYNVILKQ